MIDEKWARGTGVAGALVFTPEFERLIAELQTALTIGDGPSWCPPLMPVELLRRAEYTESFPHLLGAVQPFAPSEPSDLVLSPALCYHVYERLADKQLSKLESFDIAGYCYRHEATSELGRFRVFRMREYVAVGAAADCETWRADWLARAQSRFISWGLALKVDYATDPFFGPGSKFMRASQLEQGLKYELIAPVSAADPGTAIASANYHTDHLGARFAIRQADGSTAHSACMAFGLERIALALIYAHGNNRANWPQLGGDRWNTT